MLFLSGKGSSFFFRSFLKQRDFTNMMFLISKSGNTSRLRSLKTLPTKCTPVYSLRVNAQIVNNNNLSFLINIKRIIHFMLGFCSGCSFLEETFYLLPGFSQKLYKLHSLQAWSNPVSFACNPASRQVSQPALLTLLGAGQSGTVWVMRHREIVTVTA